MPDAALLIGEELRAFAPSFPFVGVVVMCTPVAPEDKTAVLPFGPTLVILFCAFAGEAFGAEQGDALLIPEHDVQSNEPAASFACPFNLRPQTEQTQHAM